MTHVEVIDGTRAAPAFDQTVALEHGKVVSVGPSSSVAIPAGTKVLDFCRKTVFPGLVGMYCPAADLRGARMFALEYFADEKMLDILLIEVG